MPKRVRMVAEIRGEKCTGCRLCEQVCPTVAITMRKRRADEPRPEHGPGKLLAVIQGDACYNAQACFEICPERAIVMHELEAPFDIGVDMEKTDRAAVNELCAKAGYTASREICLCTTTTAGELAAAILAGADTPEKLSLMTGARTGCLELCQQPMLDMLRAAGHTDMARNPVTGFQWYGRSATLWDSMQPDGSFPPDILEHFDVYRPDREVTDMARASLDGRKDHDDDS
ncbi:MAG: 4Fe-4S dicluster domain-containing protein [Desulfobacterales bacterium]